MRASVFRFNNPHLWFFFQPTSTCNKSKDVCFSEVRQKLEKVQIFSFTRGRQGRGKIGTCDSKLAHLITINYQHFEYLFWVKNKTFPRCLYLWWDLLPPQGYSHSYSGMQVGRQSRQRLFDAFRRLEYKCSLHRRCLVLQIHRNSRQSWERNVCAAQRVIPTAQVDLKRTDRNIWGFMASNRWAVHQTLWLSPVNWAAETGRSGGSVCCCGCAQRRALARSQGSAGCGKARWWCRSPVKSSRRRTLTPLLTVSSCWGSTVGNNKRCGWFVGSNSQNLDSVSISFSRKCWKMFFTLPFYIFIRIYVGFT